MSTILICIHGQYGSPEEAERIEGVMLDEEHRCCLQQHPIDWRVPAHIFYGEKDNLR